MKRAAWTLAMIVAAGGAGAQQRPSTPDLSCAQARQIVSSQGAAVLGTGGNTYDRFVRDQSACQIDEYTDPALVPSRDVPQCFVGYICRSGPRNEFGD